MWIFEIIYQFPKEPSFSQRNHFFVGIKKGKHENLTLFHFFPLMYLAFVTAFLAVIFMLTQEKCLDLHTNNEKKQNTVPKYKVKVQAAVLKNAAYLRCDLFGSGLFTIGWAVDMYTKAIYAFNLIFYIAFESSLAFFSLVPWIGAK